MKPLPLPDIDHKDLYEQCSKQTQNSGSRATLLGLSDKIIDAGIIYSQASAAQACHTIRAFPFNASEEKLLKPLYKKRLASKSGSGRWAYDLIKTSANMCPYCLFGEIYEVDHFLPQDDFPELNICPTNLVPICHACNNIKLSSLPVGADKYLLHPYYDNLPNTRWLYADIEPIANGPVLKFKISIDDTQYGVLAARLRYHFEFLKLDRRFQNRAATILVEIENDISAHNFKPDLLKVHFEQEAERKFKAHGNCIEAAAYLAASNNVDFCNGLYIN